MILYSKGCPQCDVLKSKLEQKGIHFTLETENFETLIKNNIDVVPILEVNGKLLKFSEAIKYVNTL